MGTAGSSSTGGAGVAAGGGSSAGSAVCSSSSLPEIESLNSRIPLPSERPISGRRFGPKRLPEMGRSLGNGMREFKESISGKDDDEPKPEPAAELPPPAATPTTPVEDEPVVPASSKRDS